MITKTIDLRKQSPFPNYQDYESFIIYLKSDGEGFVQAEFKINGDMATCKIDGTLVGRFFNQDGTLRFVPKDWIRTSLILGFYFLCVQFVQES